MTVVATLRDGKVVTLAARNVSEVVDRMSGDSLTGSAFQDTELDTDDGGTVRYADINALEEKP